MRALCDAVFPADELERILRCVKENRGPVQLCGLSPLHRVFAAAALAAASARPVAVISPDEAAAQAFAADFSVVAGRESAVLPVRELMFYDAAGISRSWEHKRIDLFNRLRTGRLTAVCGSVEAFSLRTISPQAFAAHTLTVSPGARIAPDALAASLEARGYVRADAVEGAGQFAVRGGIFDVFPPSAPQPVRMEFFGDEIDSLGVFDIATQRRVENLTACDLPPACETPPDLADGGRAAFAGRIRALTKGLSRAKLPPRLLDTHAQDAQRIEEGVRFSAADRYLPLYHTEHYTAFDHLPPDTLYLVDDRAGLREQLRVLHKRHTEDIKTLLESGILGGRQTEYYLGAAPLYTHLAQRSAVLLDTFVTQSDELPPKELVTLHGKQLPAHPAQLDALTADLRHYRSSGFSTVLLAGNEARLHALTAQLAEEGIAVTVDRNVSSPVPPGAVVLALGALSAGLELPGASFAVLNDIRAASEAKQERRVVKRDKKNRLQSFTDLREGDFVVHDAHGIGRYCGLSTLEVDGLQKDFVKLAYRGSDILYIPVTQLDALSKYLGTAEDAHVRLSSLGGADWARTRAKTKRAVQDLAKELIALYARRTHGGGHAFPPDTAWQREFEDGFDYEETDDQLVATQEIKQDMERAVPMDRLLCGDVGFGKTEVAFRAAMKAIMDSKQVALLVPTTVLARQHYLTAMHRFRGFPVRIAAFSRMNSAAENTRVLRELRTGRIDLIIGTHKLLGREVRFRDLGLVIVDEEQRFGVSHKERLKEMTVQTDVLTLSATPIPRTLNMALSGVRDMSVLEESPHDRYPVTTYVMEYDRAVVRDAVSRELSRGGQVYYLHNRVETIVRTTDGLRALFPDARIVVGHGKMPQSELNTVMQAVTDGAADILVCTTIIEAGIDIPNVNTLIVEDADRLGLAQLHQIRGRVGRSSRHAYAYFTFRAGRVLNEISQKRLQAIRDYTEFGAGFHIAMRDLEIRGAGNLLGAEQSGHMVSVGYEMYLRLLEEAVREERGEAPPVVRNCTVDLAVSATIPADYVPAAYDRMDLYRRIARISSDADVADLQDELYDRFGACPPETETLLRAALLKAYAVRAGISEIQEKNRTVVLRFSQLSIDTLRPLFDMPQFKGRVTLHAGDPPHLTVRLRAAEDAVAALTALVQALPDCS